MADSGYDGIVQHRSEHAMMRRQLSRLSTTIDQNHVSVSGTVESLQILIKGWIQNHISASDRAFARYCEQKPDTRFIELPSPKELQKAGVKVADLKQVEAVHNAEEIAPEKLKVFLKIR